MTQTSRIALVLTQAQQNPPKLQSDFARNYAAEIALCASEGYITTKLAAGFFGTRWMVTPSGLSHLYILNGVHQLCES